MAFEHYGITGSVTNTAAITQVVLTSAATVRPALADLIISSVATPADNAGDYQLKRFTAAGTTTAFTPIAFDPGAPASLSAGGVNASVEPTYTANSIPLRLATNQRATARWVARDRSEIMAPATAANGLGLFSNAVGGAAAAMLYTLIFIE